MLRMAPDGAGIFLFRGTCYYCKAWNELQVKCFLQQFISKETDCFCIRKTTRRRVVPGKAYAENEKSPVIEKGMRSANCTI